MEDSEQMCEMTEFTEEDLDQYLQNQVIISHTGPNFHQRIYMFILPQTIIFRISGSFSNDMQLRGNFIKYLYLCMFTFYIFSGRFQCGIKVR